MFSRACLVTPPMAPNNTSVPSPDTSASQPQSSQPSTLQGRPLRREGAIILLSTAEQALQDAMLRSSPTPEPLLGKRTREKDDEQEGEETEPDEEGTSATGQALPLAPSFSNIRAATSRYATHKKLRAEQRAEVEAFLQVSPSSM